MSDKGKKPPPPAGRRQELKLEDDDDAPSSSNNNNVETASAAQTEQPVRQDKTRPSETAASASKQGTSPGAAESSTNPPHGSKNGHELEEQTDKLPTSNVGRPNDLQTLKALRNEVVASADASETGADAGVTTPSGTAVDVRDFALPPRPRALLPSASDATTTDRRTAEYYHGMHPPPNSEVITSPPEQPGLADYSPWTGEDGAHQVSEQDIKTGHAHKPPVAGDIESAKKVFAPAFRHQAGIQSLSLILAATLHQRREKAKIKSPSTFKPPPRVTLTDTKREIWLNDLANPLVPLRRLSRTIPHGIRGKVLLEQCVVKMVPIPRALWLVKCVGANELRAFRRKGVTTAMTIENEQKWTTEFTIVVEVFVEDCCDMTKHQDWKTRISYALRLIYQFFAEELLDKDHFLDWALERFRHANNDLLPLTVLTVYMTLPCLTASLKHGRGLANACLEKMQDLVHSQDIDILVPLLDRLKGVIRKLAMQHPECLFLYLDWAEYRPLFLSLIQETEQVGAAAVEDFERNASLKQANALKKAVEHNDTVARATGDSIPSKNQIEFVLVCQLDKLQPDARTEEVAQYLHGILPQVSQVVALIVQWSISLHRDGLHMYLTARLIRQYRKLHHDTDEYILNSWARYCKQTVASPKKLGRLIAELARTGDFNAARFLRWLIARGGVNEKDTPFELQVLLDLPIESQPLVVASLQKSLLDRLKGSLPDQLTASSSQKQVVLDRIRLELQSEPTGDKLSALQLSTADTASLTCADMFEISDDVRERLAIQMREKKDDVPLAATPTVELSPLATTKLLSPATLTRIVRILELTGDHIVLAEVLSLALNACELDTFTLVSNLFFLHFESISAVGLAPQICQKLCDGYRDLRKSLPPLREVVMNLISVCSRISSFGSLIDKLKQMLAACEAGLGIAANTPKSDIQFDSNGNSDVVELEPELTVPADADEDQIKSAFEAALLKATTNSQDEQLLSQLMSFLLKLKRQHETIFEELTASWIQDTYVETPAQNLYAEAIIVLLNADCLDAEDFVRLVDEACDDCPETNRDLAVAASLKTLNIFFCRAKNCTNFPITRASVKFQRFTKDNPEALLPCVRRCISALYRSSATEEVAKLPQNDGVLSMLRHATVHNECCLQELLEGRSSENQLNGTAQKLMDRLVDPLDVLNLANASEAEAIRMIFATVSVTSAPVSRMFLRYVTSMTAGSEKTLHQRGRQEQAKACLEGAFTAQTRHCVLWRMLIEAVNKQVAGKICELAETQFLNNSPSTTGALKEPTASGGLDARKWTEIVEAASFGLSAEGSVETGKNIEILVNNAALAMFKGVGNTQLTQPMQQWLQALCHFIMICRTSCVAAKNGALVVEILCGILARNTGHWTARTLQSTFDAIAVLADGFSPEDLAKVKAYLGKCPRRDSVRFIFGIPDDRDGWLYAMRTSPSVPTGQNASQSQSQSQSQEQPMQQPFPIRRWELLPDLSQNPEANDTALSMRLFDASKDT